MKYSGDVFPNIQLHKGDIYKVFFTYPDDPTQGKDKYIVILQDDKKYSNSPTVIIAVATSKIDKRKFDTDVILTDQETGLINYGNSRIILGQLHTIPKSLLNGKKPIGKINEEGLVKVDKALRISLHL